MLVEEAEYVQTGVNKLLLAFGSLPILFTVISHHISLVNISRLLFFLLPLEDLLDPLYNGSRL